MSGNIPSVPGAKYRIVFVTLLVPNVGLEIEINIILYHYIIMIIILFYGT